MLMSLQIASSSLAALIGMHTYEPTKVAMVKLWEKTDPRGLRAQWLALHPPGERKIELDEGARRAAHAAVRAAARSAAPVAEVHAAVGAAVDRVHRHVSKQVERAQEESDKELERALEALPDGQGSAAGRAAARAIHAAAHQEHQKQAAVVLKREQDEIRRKAFTTRGIKDENKALVHAAVDRFHAIMQDEKEQRLLLSAVEDAWHPRYMQSG